MDNGILSCFQGKIWNGIGPIHYVGVSKEEKASGQWITNAWVAGETGVYSTAQAGNDDARWTRLTPRPDGPECYSNFAGITPIDKFQELYAFGWQGIAHWRTGEPWAVELKALHYSVSNVRVLASDRREAWAAVPNLGGGAIFRYRESSAKWERLPLPGILFDNTEQGIYDILPSSPNSAGVVLAVGSSGLILRGSNGGTSFLWRRIPSHTKQALLSIALDDASNLWVVGNYGTILRSRNGGNTWEECPCFDEHGARISDTFTRVKFSNQQGWIVGTHTLLRFESP
jgi:photosystem II stability/assembly factor-like uncharacterized protein